MTGSIDSRAEARAPLFMRALLLCWGIGLMLALLPVRAQAADQAGPLGRFLFIVETSKAMKREMPDAIRVRAGTPRVRPDGQLRPGDTVGVWTFMTARCTPEFFRCRSGRVRTAR